MAACRAWTTRPISISTSCKAAPFCPVDDRVMPFLKTEDPGMEVFPMVNNFDGSELGGGYRRFSE